MCRDPGSGVQSARAMHRALGVVYRAPEQCTEPLEQRTEPLEHRTEPQSNAELLEQWMEPLEQCRALGAVHRAPRTRHTAPEQCVEPQAPAGSSIWVNPCLAPGRRLENRSGSCPRNLCSLLELPRGTMAALCGTGSQSPAPGALQCCGGCGCCPLPPWVRLFLVVTEGCAAQTTGHAAASQTTIS